MPFDDTSRGEGGGGGGRWYSNDDATNVLYFLRQAEIEADFYQLIHAKDAFESACRIMMLDPDHVRKHLDI